MAILTINYETMVKSLVDGPTEEDRINNQAGVDESLDAYLEHIKETVESEGHSIDIRYNSNHGSSLQVGGGKDYNDEQHLWYIVETKVPAFWEWYN